MSDAASKPGDESPEMLRLRSELEAALTELRLAKLRIAQLQSKLFGRSSEKFSQEDAAQLPLIELDEQAAPPGVPTVEDAVAPEAEEKAAPRKPVRQPLPEHLEKVTEVIDVPEAEKVCNHCGKEKCEIGQEVTEELEIIPARFIRKQIVRPKYACACGEAKVVIAPLPPRLIEKGRCGPGLLTWLLLGKFSDHLPLYRLQQIVAERHDLHLPRQSMADWMEKAAEALQPIWREMKAQMLAGDYLQADETPVRVQDPDVKGKTATGFLWVYAQPGHDVLFEFDQSRSLAPPLRFLEGFKGTLQTDGYNVYESLVTRRPEIRRIGCWAHARRKFREATEDDPVQAVWFLEQIGLLYRVERIARERGLTAEERHALRQQESLPVLRTIEQQLEAFKTKYLPQSPMGKAIQYALGQGTALRACFENGAWKIDNNLVENAIRPSALGKKNWLFIGHPEAAWRSAVIYSIIVSCRRRGINPAEYLADIFQRLPTAKITEVSQLTPANWQKSH